MKKFLIFSFCLFSFVASIFAEETSTTFVPEVSMAQQAIASPDYIVTPGDIYSLAMQGTTISVTIDSSYRLRVGSLGVINVKGLTFQELKNKVENLVISNYPTANVQFVITNPASFKVVITGEVTAAGEVTTWSLRRLSDVIKGRLTPYASTRQIIVESDKGVQKKYDIFQATRFGDMSQDPYLRPGDKIIVPKYERKVKLLGAVKRPGVYELLPDEQIQDLINVLGDGYTEDANKDDILLKRFVGGKEVWEKKHLKETDVIADINLFSKDEVNVLSYSLTRSVFYVEGSIVVEKEKDSETTEDAATEIEVEKDIDTSTKYISAGTVSEPVSLNRILVEFDVGTSYAAIVKENKAWFVNNSADLENAYIRRKIQNENSEPEEEIIKIDLKKILYGSGFYEDLIVQADDVLYVPYVQYYVFVNGAVNAVGRYPYQAGKNYMYYVNLANGIDLNQNVFGTVTIKTKEGKRLSKKSVIPPEAVISVHRNSPSGGWLMPIIVSILTLISTVLTCFISIRDIGWI